MQELINIHWLQHLKTFWRNQNQASAGGLGILQDSKAAQALSEVIQWTERIMIVL